MSIHIDPRSGFCNSNSIFYSKRKPTPLPCNDLLDVTTFISSCPHNGNIAFIDATTGRHLTFPQVWSAVDSVASCLSSQMGIRKGQVVLLLSPNSIFFPIVCLSVMSVGAVITTSNPLNTPQEIHKQVADSKPVLAFTTQSLLPKLSGMGIPVILIGQHDTDLASKQTNVVVSSSLEEMMKTEPSQSGLVKERVRQDDTATLLYSSGTTGASKGVVSSHRNLIVMVQTIASGFVTLEATTFLCTVPMFHIYGLGVFATALLAVGATVVILPKFDFHEMLTMIDTYGVKCLPLVPPIVVALVNQAEKVKAKYDLRTLQWILSGGAPLSKEVIESFSEKYPTVTILQGYAMTETTGLGASVLTVEESNRYGTAGLLAASLEAKIVDPETGEAVSVNRPGELWLRGPSVMKGYFNNPNATAMTLDREGWLRTGDICFIDEEGYIFVVDRLKELIKYKGYQVPPAELEAVLLTHPEIADAAVIPFPDKLVGQYPMAYVVRRAGSNLSATSVMDFVSAQVALYKRIRRVEFVSVIPKNPSGKILRKDLMKLANSNL